MGVKPDIYVGDRTFVIMFPSPCGVMGVKLVSQEEIQDTLAYLVSVPLRGNGCETVALFQEDGEMRLAEFPSPCGVMGVKRIPAPLSTAPNNVLCFRPLAG